MLAPRISIIIPTFNRALLVREAIDSVMAQTFADFEVIVVDDGSTDDTKKVVLELLDPRVIYIRQENKGRSHARNYGLDIAQGCYIAFLDSDDVYLPEKLAIQVSYLDKNSHVGMVYTSAYCIDGSGNLLDESYIATVSGDIYSSIAFFRPVTITLPTVMVRKELFEQVGGFDEKMHRFEDTDMWRRISKATQIDALPEFTCKLRTHPGNSLGAQRPVELMSSLDFYAKKILREDSSKGVWALRRGLGEIYYYYGRAFLTIPEWKEQGEVLLRSAYRYWPPTVLKYPLSRLRVLFGTV